MTADNVLVRVRDLVKHFPIHQGILIQRQIGAVRAVDGISFDVHQGETLEAVTDSQKANFISAPSRPMRVGLRLPG